MITTEAFEQKIAEKAKELDIEFKMEHSTMEGEETEGLIFHIKRNIKVPCEEPSQEEIEKYDLSFQNLETFTDFVADLVIGNYAEYISFRYTSEF